MSNKRIKGGALHDLRQALEVLVETHTRDDPLIGFTVRERGPEVIERFFTSEYLAAWAQVRRALGYQTAQDARPE